MILQSVHVIVELFVCTVKEKTLISSNLLYENVNDVIRVLLLDGIYF